MKSYIFGTLRTRFLMQLVLLAGFFVSVSVVRADLITFQFEGELTRVDSPLEEQFSVGDSFGGTYTFESNTEPVFIDNYDPDYPSDADNTVLYSNAIKALDFNSGSYMAVAESGDIEDSIDFNGAYYDAKFNSVDGVSVGGYIPQRIGFVVEDFVILNFSSNPIHPEYNEYNGGDYLEFSTGSMGFSFEEIGSQNSSYIYGRVFSISLVDRISTTIVPNN